MVYLHENLKEVEIKYDFSLALPQAPADPDDPDAIVVVAWATESNQFIQSIYSFIVLYREKSSEKPQKSIFYVKENKFISKLSLFFDNYVVFTVIFVISRNLRSFNRNFW